jgi:hypothetical protein
MRYLLVLLFFIVAFVTLLQFGSLLLDLASIPVFLVAGLVNGVLQSFGITS